MFLLPPPSWNNGEAVPKHRDGLMPEGKVVDSMLPGDAKWHGIAPKLRKETRNHHTELELLQKSRNAAGESPGSSNGMMLASDQPSKKRKRGYPSVGRPQAEHSSGSQSNEQSNVRKVHSAGTSKLLRITGLQDSSISADDSSSDTDESLIMSSPGRLALDALRARPRIEKYQESHAIFTPQIANVFASQLSPAGYSTVEGGAGAINLDGVPRTCSNCGQVGHVETNKRLCHLLNGAMKLTMGQLEVLKKRKWTWIGDEDGKADIPLASSTAMASSTARPSLARARLVPKISQTAAPFSTDLPLESQSTDRSQRGRVAGGPRTVNQVFLESLQGTAKWMRAYHPPTEEQILDSRWPRSSRSRSRHITPSITLSEGSQSAQSITTGDGAPRSQFFVKYTISEDMTKEESCQKARLRLLYDKKIVDEHDPWGLHSMVN